MPPNKVPVRTRITTTVRTEKSVELNEKQLADILREYFNMPNGKINFDCSSYGDFNSVSLTYVEETTDG